MKKVKILSRAPPLERKLNYLNNMLSKNPRSQEPLGKASESHVRKKSLMSM